MFSFVTAIRKKYVLAASLPREDYPPANIAAMLKQCEDIGRSDLAKQIQAQWEKVLKKYPKTRLNWPTAVVIGGNSIKKNVFGGKEFAMWLKDQEAEVPSEAKKIPSVLPPPKEAPAIAIPKKNETSEDWAAEAAKTKEALVAAKQAFTDVKEYISYLEKEANDLKKKISTYGKGGPKEKTKSGAPSKYSERVPKWVAQLEATASQIEETKKNLKEAEVEFKGAVNNYNSAPVTTVAYEKKAKESLDNILTYVLNMKDLDKQRELLVKIDETLGKQKTVAGAEEIIAGDRLAGLFEKFKVGFKNLKSWLLGLKKSVSSFSKLAAIRY